MSTATVGRIPSKFQGFSARKERWLQAILQDDELPRNAIRVALALSKFFNSKTGTCWPSISTLSGIGRFVDRTAQRLIRALEGRGYLAVQRQAGAKGTNRYQMVIPGEIAQGSMLAQQGEEAPRQAQAPAKIPEIVWISKDSPEWETASAAWRRDHRKAPPVDKRGGWWFERKFQIRNEPCGPSL